MAVIFQGKKIRLGDVLFVSRKKGMYDHYGLFTGRLGQGKVVHLTSTNGVSLVSLFEFAGGEKIQVERNNIIKSNRESIVREKLSELSDKYYNILGYNCESFAKGYSKQVQEVIGEVPADICSELSGLVRNVMKKARDFF